MFKKSTVFILYFAPSVRFTLSLQSAFYPWSAVCSLQAAVCVLHRHFHISHNAPSLPPKILHTVCFQFLLGRL